MSSSLDSLILTPESRLEILSKYADVLRVGRLFVNDKLCEWDVKGQSKEVPVLLSRKFLKECCFQGWLTSFCVAFCHRLRILELTEEFPSTPPRQNGHRFSFDLRKPLLPSGNPSDGWLVYWICKATSINYALFEVSSFVQKELGEEKMVCKAKNT
jgi:hypothetical protein